MGKGGLRWRALAAGLAATVFSAAPLAAQQLPSEAPPALSVYRPAHPEGFRFNNLVALTALRTIVDAYRASLEGQSFLHAAKRLLVPEALRSAGIFLQQQAVMDGSTFGPLYTGSQEVLGAAIDNSIHGRRACAGVTVHYLYARFVDDCGDISVHLSREAIEGTAWRLVAGERPAYKESLSTGVPTFWFTKTSHFMEPMRSTAPVQGDYTLGTIGLRDLSGLCAAYQHQFAVIWRMNLNSPEVQRDLLVTQYSAQNVQRLRGYTLMHELSHFAVNKEWLLGFHAQERRFSHASPPPLWPPRDALRAFLGQESDWMPDLQYTASAVLSIGLYWEDPDEFIARSTMGPYIGNP